MTTKPEDIVLEDCRLLFRNFAGAAGRFNAEGDRNFNVALGQQEAVNMELQGWNVKYLQPKEEGELPQPIIKVAVSYKGRPPRIVLITSKGKTPLDESMIALLDWAEITHVDLILNPYAWEVSGKTGIKAYLKSIYVTIREDELELKYRDVPDSAAGSITSVTEPEEEAPFR